MARVRPPIRVAANYGTPSPGRRAGTVVNSRPVSLARARQFLQAIAAHDFDAAEAFLDPEVETVTPRTTFHGIAECRSVLQKASGDDQFTMEQSEPQVGEIEGDVLARTPEVARWRETGEIAYEREVAVRLTFDDERIVKIVVMPGGAPPAG